MENGENDSTHAHGVEADIVLSPSPADLQEAEIERFLEVARHERLAYRLFNNIPKRIFNPTYYPHLSS